MQWCQKYLQPRNSKSLKIILVEVRYGVTSHKTRKCPGWGEVSARDLEHPSRCIPHYFILKFYLSAGTKNNYKEYQVSSWIIAEIGEVRVGVVILAYCSVGLTSKSNQSSC